MSIENSFFHKLRTLRDLLSQHPNAATAIKELQPLLNDPDIRREFLKDLQQAEWAALLHQAGYFDNPPCVKKLPDHGVQHPAWPESRYLARMATHIPEQVVNIFITIKTDNQSIINDIVQGALAMPVKTGSKLIPTICVAAQNGLLQLCFENTTNLCVRLAKEGEISAAESLAQALFTPNFERRTNPNRGWDEFQYKEGLEKVIPALAKRIESDKFFINLCDWLLVFVEAKERCHPDTGADYSYLWRPAVEEHGENQDYNFASSMVGFVREGFEQAIENGKISLERAIEIVDQYRYLIFKRIRLHLINMFTEKNPILARQTIMNRDLFKDDGYKHEYAMLVGSRFSLLTNKEKRDWFSWIENDAPSNDPEDSRFTEEQKRNRTRYWKYQRLHWVRAHLEEEHQKIYENMRTEFGEPVMADLNIRLVSGSWGNESSVTVEDLSKLTFQEAVVKVSNWQPTTSYIFGPSIEGLATAFEEYIATQPKIFSEQARFLIGSPAIYVRKFISQMAREIKSEKQVDIASILELCSWVLSRPFDECTTLKQDGSGFLDHNWRWTRDEISLLLRNIYERAGKDIPDHSLAEFGKQIWNLIANLCSVPEEPCVNSKIDEIDPRSQDYVETGINSSKGKAMEAVLAYARWMFTYYKSLGSPLENFEAIPEVKYLIESRIASSDRTSGELALIGSNVNLIYAIDKRWLETNTDTIFPIFASPELPPKAIEWAAWNAFLGWTQPHIEFYRIFRKQFAYATKQYSLIKPSTSSSSNPIYRLGEHLAILYIRGEIPLEEEGGSFRQFLSESKHETRRHTLEFIGRLLDRHEEVSPAIITRCRNLWETYWLDTGKADAQKTPNTWSFEKWFSSGKFPAEWAMGQLEKYLSVAEIPDISNEVVEELANIATNHTNRATSILDKIVQSDKEGWRIAGWQNAAYIILGKAMKVEEGPSEQAQKLISYLGRSGYMQFGELLP